MAKNKGWDGRRGILGITTGSYNDLVITKKNVIYARKASTQKDKKLKGKSV
jgi:hypothetical protein